MATRNPRSVIFATLAGVALLGAGVAVVDVSDEAGAQAVGDEQVRISEGGGSTMLGVLPVTVEAVDDATTTTGGATTTTAAPPTTTTEPPPTTTTTEPPEPPIGTDPTPIISGGRYDIYVIGRLGSPTAVKMWEAPYYHQLSSGAGWDPGDRSAYRYSYGFLHHNPAGPEPDDQVFRFSFAGGYGGTIAVQVGDQGMDEAERFYDCTRYDVAPAGLPNNDAHGCGIIVGPATSELRDSPRPSWIGPTAEPPDRRPVIRVVHTATGQVVEVRGYVNPVNADPGTTFSPIQHLTTPFQVSGDTPNPNKPDAYDSGPHTVYERFVVGAWLDGDNAVAVYYDVLNPAYHLDIMYPLED